MLIGGMPGSMPANRSASRMNGERASGFWAGNGARSGAFMDRLHGGNAPAGSAFWHSRRGQVKARLTNRRRTKISLFEPFQRPAEIGFGHRRTQAARQAAPMLCMEDAGVREGL